MWMDRVLPDWLEKGVESTLRDSDDDAPPAPLVPTAISSAGQMRNMGPSPPVVLTPTVSRPSSRNGTKGPWQDLDSFYAEEEEEEDDEEDDDDGEEGSSEEDEDEDDEGTGSDDDVTVKTS